MYTFDQRGMHGTLVDDIDMMRCIYIVGVYSVCKVDSSSHIVPVLRVAVKENAFMF